MKIRLDYVTNSSSSSYVCLICDNEVCGMDIGLSEADMCECVNGHVFCTDHKLEPAKDIVVKTDGDEDEDDDDDDCYAVPKKYCPLCSMQEVSDIDLLQYLIVLSGHSRKVLENTIKHGFEDYDKFKAYLKGAA